MTAPATAPILETQRTILRAFTLADFEDYARMWTEPEVLRFISKRAHTREESWQRFLRHAGMWTLRGLGIWAIEEKSTGRMIGEVGFQDLKRDITPSIEGLAETGWSLTTDAQGRGLGTEVVTAVLGWGDKALPGKRQVCIINPQNQASIKLATKCGFRNPVDATYQGDAILLFERYGGVPNTQ